MDILNVVRYRFHTLHIEQYSRLPASSVSSKSVPKYRESWDYLANDAEKELLIWKTHMQCFYYFTRQTSISVWKENDAFQMQLMMQGLLQNAFIYHVWERHLQFPIFIHCLADGFISISIAWPTASGYLSEQSSIKINKCQNGNSLPPHIWSHVCVYMHVHTNTHIITTTLSNSSSS